jgi:excisionase family DNA binding protein
MTTTMISRQLSPPARLVSYSEAAARAANSPAWWRKLVARRQIPVVKLGRSSRLREEDVDRIIAEGFRPARVQAVSGALPSEPAPRGRPGMGRDAND